MMDLPPNLHYTIGATSHFKMITFSFQKCHIQNFKMPNIKLKIEFIYLTTMIVRK